MQKCGAGDGVGALKCELSQRKRGAEELLKSTVFIQKVTVVGVDGSAEGQLSVT